MTPETTFFVPLQVVMKQTATLPRVRVFAHHCECFRWRTLIQVGDDHTIRGTVWMKNPGSSRPIAEPVSMFDIDALRDIDDSADWYPFTVDPTMRAIVNLFSQRSEVRGEVFTGIIQIFNIINVMNPEVDEAIKAYESSSHPLRCTIDEDIRNTVPPVYVGWGDFHRNSVVGELAQEVLQALEAVDDIGYQAEAGFIHPLYLMVYGSNKTHCQELKDIFCQR